MNLAMEGDGKSDADYWKRHLHWDLLERNLGPIETVKLDELCVVRRWLFSNRKGLESPFFAQLRTLTNEYVDAVFTLQHPDLQAAFVRQVQLARQQCDELAQNPNDASAVALGRTLGWFEQTRQLSEEVERLRKLLSHPNAQMVVGDSLIARIVAGEVADVNETVEVAETVDVPGSGPLQRSRTMRLRGSASTNGGVTLSPTPNDNVAELSLKFVGEVDSTARGAVGPVTLRMAVGGSAVAIKPIYISPSGLELGKTQVSPSVSSRVVGLNAESDVAERIARRRIEQAESRALMNRRARATTSAQLKERLDERVQEAFDKLRADASRVESSVAEFQEVVAPLEREGAVPHLAGFTSSATAIQLNALAVQRGQFGAAAPCPHEETTGDVQLRLHVSAFNNMAETITGGKTLNDRFFMKYAKVLHAELPLPLMVHSRSTRWGFTMQKHRPIELVIPRLNHFRFVMRIAGVEVNGKASEEPAVATIDYRLEQDDLGEYALQRVGGVDLQTNATPEVRRLIHEKVDAFFGPALSGAGIVIPESGVLAPLTRLRTRGVHAEHEWISVPLDVPQEAIDEFLRFRRQEGAPL